ncbi:hypothetical protein BH10ACT2_BH10ACT2_19760 [soil metagenome]
MPHLVACAIVRDDPPQVFIAEDEATLNWVLALRLIARTPGNELPPGLRDQLRSALRNEQWGQAVELWMHSRPEVDVYPSLTLYAASDVELAAQELEFTPLFKE